MTRTLLRSRKIGKLVGNISTSTATSAKPTLELPLHCHFLKCTNNCRHFNKLPSLLIALYVCQAWNLDLNFGVREKVIEKCKMFLMPIEAVALQQKSSRMKCARRVVYLQAFTVYFICFFEIVYNGGTLLKNCQHLPHFEQSKIWQAFLYCMSPDILWTINFSAQLFITKTWQAVDPIVNHCCLPLHILERWTCWAPSMTIVCMQTWHKGDMTQMSMCIHWFRWLLKCFRSRQRRSWKGLKKTRLVSL